MKALELPVANETSIVLVPPSLAVSFALLASVESFLVALVAVNPMISIAFKVAPALTTTTSCSEPEAPPRSFTLSSPESIVMMSLPAPPVMISSPAPPVIVSTLVPPTIVSAPPPLFMVFAKLPAVIVKASV